MKIANLSLRLNRAVLAATCGLLLGPPEFAARAQDTPAPDAAISAATNTITLEAVDATPGAQPSNALTIEAFADSKTSTYSVRVGQPSKTSSAIVLFGSNYTVKSNETVESVVLFGGNAHILGKVTEDVVIFGGNADLSGAAGGDLVVFGGNARLDPGASVKGDVVTLGGNIRLASAAKVGGDLVPLGGSADVAPDATVSGTVQHTGFDGLRLALPEWLKDWFTDCVFKLRPLAFGVPWVWGVVGLFFLCYLLTAIVFHRPVRACVQHLTDSPATSFLVGLLGKLLFPLIVGMFAITGIGLLGIPFLFAALFIAVLIGKVALFEYLGLQLGRAFKSAALQRPLLAFLVGWLLITLLYLVPVLGLLVLVVSSMWGLGAALMALFNRTRSEKPPQAFSPAPPIPTPAWTLPANPAPFYPTLPSTEPAAASAALVSGFVPPASGPALSGTPPSIPTAAAPVLPATPPEALALPRATFWPRLASVSLDTVLVAMVCGPIGLMQHGPGFFFLAGVAYFTAMWTWKGSTVGSIVCGLKVVRLDGQPLTWVVALVRALAALFGVCVMFLGFLWILWDSERQGWHDKIAGTVVVKLPRGTPLV
jgi:uncharacterized RDD family membrane protein YckC